MKLPVFVASGVFLFAATGCIIEEKPANTAPSPTAEPAAAGTAPTTAAAPPARQANHRPPLRAPPP